MQLIVLIGIPGSGKSSFYKKYFFNTHVRISLDLLNTRNKEMLFMQLGFSLQQRMVVDNTNVTKKERAVYISSAKMNRFKVCGYFFETSLAGSIGRNEERTGKEKIKKVGIIAKFKALEVPALEEGFDELYTVRIENEEFIIKDNSTTELKDQ